MYGACFWGMSKYADKEVEILVPLMQVKGIILEYI